MHERRLMDIDQSCIFVRQMIFYRQKDRRYISPPRIYFFRQKDIQRACEARVAAPREARMSSPVRAYERSEWRCAG